MATKEQISTLAGEMVKKQEGFNSLSIANAQSAILEMPAFIACACEAWTNRNLEVTTQPVTQASPVSQIIQLSALPPCKLPTWAERFILVGVKEPQTLDLTKLPTKDSDTSVFWHPNQKGNLTRPTGHEVFKLLVPSYTIGGDKKGMTYQVKPEDLINGHYGLKELNYLAENWNILPEPFRIWAKGKLLYGHRDCVRRGNGELDSPYLDCCVRAPYVDWYDLARRWSDDEPALREQVGD